MGLKKSKYFHLVAAIAVIGLFTSLVHYHSEGLECLDHAEDTHFVQTEDYCPVSTLISDAVFETSLSFEGFLFPQDLVLDIELSIENPSLGTSRFGRAPPSLA